MARNVEIAILGGGCAGLSLAKTLALANPPFEVVVLEERATYLDDRTWSGWATEPHAFADCVRKRWSRWRVSTDRGRYETAGGKIAYESIAARAFYASARRAIDAAPRIDLLTGVSVADVEARGDGATIALANGERIEAQWVIDTIPRSRVLAYPWMWQSFVGFEIECPGAGGDDIPELMDFRVPQLGGATFLYTLPFAPNRALFELTCFSADRTNERDLQRTLLRLLARRFPGGFRHVRNEHAHLPMSPSDRRPNGRVVPAGTTGGAMRPATGFAFHAIQRWASHCASELCAGRPPSVATTHPALLWMDRIFMSIINDEPEAAPALYARLFSGANPDGLVRFLAGTPHVLDIASVVAALPLAKFTRAAARASGLHAPDPVASLHWSELQASRYRRSTSQTAM